MLIYGLPAAAADPALKSLNLLLEAQTRRAVTRELMRKPPTLESQLIDAASVVCCTECDAPYGAGPDACMHATCECGHKFCAFCWQPQSQCRTEECLYNPRPGSIHCSNKNVAFSVIKAVKIADLLRTVPAAMRTAVLQVPAVRSAFSANGLDHNLPHLVVNQGYVDLLMRAALERRYGGTDGTTLPTTADLQAIQAGDWVSITPDATLLRSFCTTLPMGQPVLFSPEMEVLTGKAVRVAERINRRRVLKVELPGVTSRLLYLPFDVIVGRHTAAEHALNIQQVAKAADALRQAAASGKRKMEDGAVAAAKKPMRAALPEMILEDEVAESESDDDSDSDWDAEEEEE